MDPMDSKKCDCHPDKQELEMRKEYELELRKQRWLERLHQQGTQLELMEVKE